MAHYAELDENNVVLRVVVIDNEHEPTEEAGIAYCQQLFGSQYWRKCSYNGTIRKNFPGIGYTYDPVRDAFIGPKYYPSWVFNEDLCMWVAPVPYPHDGPVYLWDEFSQNWRERG